MGETTHNDVEPYLTPTLQEGIGGGEKLYMRNYTSCILMALKSTSVN